jgi:hypothetical protein
MRSRKIAPLTQLIISVVILLGYGSVSILCDCMAGGDPKSLGPILVKYTIRLDGAVPLAGSFERRREGLQSCQEPDYPPEIGEIIISTHKITINLLADYAGPKIRPPGVYQIQRDGTYISIDREKEDEDLIFGPLGKGASQSVLTLQEDGSGFFSFNHWTSSTGKSLSGTISWTCRQLIVKK